MGKETKRNLIIVIAIAVVLVLIVAVLLFMRPFSRIPAGNTTSTPAGSTGQFQTQTGDPSEQTTDTTAGVENSSQAEQTLGAAGGVGTGTDSGRGEQTPTTGETTGQGSQTQVPQNTTEATENTVDTSNPDGTLKDLTWEEWQALTPTEQDEYTFAYTETYGFPAFSKWYKKAQEDYAAQNPVESVTGDPEVDLED